MRFKVRAFHLDKGLDLVLAHIALDLCMDCGYPVRKNDLHLVRGELKILPHDFIPLSPGQPVENNLVPAPVGIVLCAGDLEQLAVFQAVYRRPREPGAIPNEDTARVGIIGPAVRHTV